MENENTKNNKKVLLMIDDDPVLLRAYEAMFKLHGVEPLLAKSGEEGLKKIQSELPDFVVIDIRMPNMTGIDLLKILRKDEKFKNLPVLVLTNYDLQEYRKETEGLSVVDFIVKTDIRGEELVKKVTGYLLGDGKEQIR